MKQFFLHIFFYTLIISWGTTNSMNSSLKDSRYHSLKNERPIAPTKSNALSLQNQDLAKIAELEKRIAILEEQNKSITESRIHHIQKNLMTQIGLTTICKNKFEHIETTLARLPITITRLAADKNSIEIPLQELLEKIDENLASERNNIEEVLEKNLTEKLRIQVDKFTHEKVTEQNQAFYTGKIAPLNNKLNELTSQQQGYTLWLTQNIRSLSSNYHKLNCATTKLSRQFDNLNTTTSNQKYTLDLVKDEVKFLRKELRFAKNQNNKVARRKSF